MFSRISFSSATRVFIFSTNQPPKTTDFPSSLRHQGRHPSAGSLSPRRHPPGSLFPSFFLPKVAIQGRHQGRHPAYGFCPDRHPAYGFYQRCVKKRVKVQIMDISGRSSDQLRRYESALVKGRAGGFLRVFFLHTAEVWSTSSLADACRCGLQQKRFSCRKNKQHRR